MKFSITVFVSFLILLSFKVPNVVAVLSLQMKSECESWVRKSEFEDLNKALICGTQLRNSEQKWVFQTTGIIHILVVSGSHLIFLQTLLAVLANFIFKRRMSFKLELTVLILFTLMTGLQAPCVRSLLQIVANQTNQKMKLFWRPWQVVLISGIYTLALFPQWLTSTSLLLSWICSLALAVAPMHWKPAQKHILIYLFILPALASIAIPHPFVILVNLIIVPIVGGFIFPMALLSTAIPSLLFISDFVWSVLIQTLTLFTDFMPSLGQLPLPSTSIWFLLVCVHITLHINYVSKKQNA